MLQNETNSNKMYKITTTKIFIRKEPPNGRRVDVWTKGHRFIAKGEKEAGGITWLEIAKDCGLEECKELPSPLWVSKKYTEEISQDIKNLSNN